MTNSFKKKGTQFGNETKKGYPSAKLGTYTQFGDYACKHEGHHGGHRNVVSTLCEVSLTERKSESVMDGRQTTDRPGQVLDTKKVRMKNKMKQKVMKGSSAYVKYTGSYTKTA